MAISSAEDPVFSTYAYSYPHKSSYRRLEPPVRIADAWQDEKVDQLSLYVHIPFCEMRCGFCNLFTESQPLAETVDAYLDTLFRQFQVIRSEVPDARFQQIAIGGGTPTILPAAQLRDLFARLRSALLIDIATIPTSIEISPATATAERLDVLAEFGIQRVSLGVQSFVEQETRRIGRPQSTWEVQRAIEAIRERGFPVLNLDLIYGDPAQTRDSWLLSLESALRHEPDELYLYPLYIRPETGLARLGRELPRHRQDLYRIARDRLRAAGYIQTSLRCFRLPSNQAPSSYACQRDGMIGLGCGARSYTRHLHYATRFAVTRAGVSVILREWIRQTNEDLRLATHGIHLSPEEQRRRYLIMSLLQAEGMLRSDYQDLFLSPPEADIPELEELRKRNWLTRATDRFCLTDQGMEHSDEVGPLLYSDAVRSALRESVNQ